MNHLGISPWTDYTAHVVGYVLAVVFFLAVIFLGAFFVINFGLMSRRDEDAHGGQEPSDVGLLAKERFKGAHAHREYLPAEEGPEEYWRPEQEQPINDQDLLHEEEMPPDLPHLVRERRALIRSTRRPQKDETKSA